MERNSKAKESNKKDGQKLISRKRERSKHNKAVDGEDRKEIQIGERNKVGQKRGRRNVQWVWWEEEI